MYNTCLFCNSSLGTNEVIEHFPVGRRIAYDNATGRLWVVCLSCARWNLSPLETRWEAMEDAERLFRATKLRASSENIGLARVSEGTELVRIGTPLKSEFAAWRYGDQFGKRRRQSWVTAGGSLAISAGVVGAIAGEHFLGVGSGMAARGLMFGGMSLNMLNAVIAKKRSWILSRKPSIVVRANNSEHVRLTAMSVRETSIHLSKRDEEWKLRVQNSVQQPVSFLGRMMHEREQIEPVQQYTYITGDAAMRALTTILPHVNAAGAGPKDIQRALGVIDTTADVRSLIHKAVVGKRDAQVWNDGAAGNLHCLPAQMRLALEIAMHSDDERRAMDGELAELELRWKEADVLAKIADGLLLPPDVDRTLDALRERNA